MGEHQAGFLTKPYHPHIVQLLSLPEDMFPGQYNDDGEDSLHKPESSARVFGRFRA